MHAKRAYFVDNTLFHSILDVVRSDFVVLSSPGALSILPPTVRRTHLGSDFCGRRSTTIRTYGTVLSGGMLQILSSLIKKKVSVHSMRPLYPWDNLPISFHMANAHISRVLSCFNNF